jgi:ferredoxin
MGHLAGKDAFRALGQKLDSLQVRTPYDPALRAILEELYTSREAEVVARMPSTFSSLSRIARVTGIAATELEPVLEGLCTKGLVLDVWFESEGVQRYAPCPYVIGVYEMTMMRTASDEDHRRRAQLFRDYMDTFLAANFGDGQRVSIARTLPHDGTPLADDHVEVLDYERASSLVEQGSRFAVGACACRHEKHHLGTKACDVPIETCTTFDYAADYVIRRGFGREIDRAEMKDRLAESRERGLVLNADNVQQRATFICHCCSCCCGLLLGVKRYGHPSTVVSSNFVAEADPAACAGCGKCAESCPVDAIELRRPTPEAPRKLARPHVDESMCLGCGVCAVRCSTDAMRLAPRQRRVFHPETTFERVMLLALERGNLQSILFDNPNSKTEGFARSLLGGFLRLRPVKRALVSDTLRSAFLRSLTSAARSRPRTGAATRL